MRVTLGQLRRMILREMKLGIAGAQGDARSWGKKPLPDDPAPYEPPEGGETYIATEEPPNFEPDEETKEAWRQHIQNMAKASADEPWEPEEYAAWDAERAKKKHVSGGSLDEEAGSVERDPFAEPRRRPGSLSAEDLKRVGRVLARVEEELGPVPDMLTDLTKLTRAPKARAMFQKAAGLGYHAMNDLRAMIAILEIYLRKASSN